MTVLIYRPKPSAGAVALAQALRDAGIPAKKVRRLPRRHPERHKIINWGACAGQGLNNQPTYGKYTEIQKLVAAGVPTVDATLQQTEGYLYRNFSHVGGNDLLNPEAAQHRPGFWVKQVMFDKEFRVHVFQGQSIRAGRKTKVDENAHPWIRSFDGGWRIVYDGHGVKDKHREVAKQAVAALGLDFAAVDVGERPDGTVFVLEVNRAPGLQGNTVAAYRDKVRAWLEA